MANPKTFTKQQISTTSDQDALQIKNVAGTIVGWIDSTGTGQGNLASGGGGTPGGSNTQVQFNDSGSFGGSAAFIFNKTNGQTNINGDLYLSRPAAPANTAAEFFGTDTTCYFFRNVNDFTFQGPGNINFNGTGTAAFGSSISVISTSGVISIGKFTVAGLPTGAEGQIAYATNGRKVGEGGGSGTGVPVYFSNGSWRVYSTDAAVQA
jgi:hypothetical protein